MKKIAFLTLLLALLLPPPSFGAVTSTVNSVTYTCSGSTGPYPFTFPIIPDTSAIQVSETIISSGATTILSPSAYTGTAVNNNYENGGSILLSTACPSGNTLKIQRITPLTQTSTFTNNMPTLYKTFETGLDKLTLAEQDYSNGTQGPPGPTGPTGATGAPGGVTSISAGSGITVSSPTGVVTISNPSYAQNADNILPNVNWQAWTGLASGGAKMNYQGTGTQGALAVTSFTTSSNTPTFYTSSTGQLKVGDLIYITTAFWRYSGINSGNPISSPNICVRVASVTPNASFSTAPAAFNGISPASSSAISVVPTTAYNNGSISSGATADGWVQTITLATWPDDFSVNSYPGAIRPMGVRKGVNSAEYLSWNCPKNQMSRYAGRTITFGANVYQKVQGGTGTWKLWITDGINITYSSSGLGSSVGGYQFLSVTATINSAASSIGLYLEFDGLSQDVYYVALPTAVMGSVLAQNNCRQMSNDIVRPIGHWNPPFLAPLQYTFANVPLGSSSLYGVDYQDLEAISFGAVHNSLFAVDVNIELTTSTPGAIFIVGSGNYKAVTWGPEAITQVAGITSPAHGVLPLNQDGTFCLFTGTPSLAVTSATFDFGTLYLTGSGQAQ